MITKNLLRNRSFLLVIALLSTLLFVDEIYPASARRRRARRPRIVAQAFEPKPDFFIHGIDVSKHMDRIDWGKVKDQGIDFVFIKATEGGSYVDPKYNEYLQGAKSANLNIGVYHFFRFERPAEDQIENFIRHVNVLDLQIHPVLDIEEAVNINRPSSTDLIISEIRKFLYQIEDLYNVKMIIYANVSDYNKYIKGHFDDYPLWICSLRENAGINDKWHFWQYSHKTRVQGIRYPVDMNVFHGTQEQWSKYLSEMKKAFRYIEPKCISPNFRTIKSWDNIYEEDRFGYNRTNQYYNKNKEPASNGLN